MKKILFIVLSISTSLTFSQEITIPDGLLFGIDNTVGTARYRGLNGAMGALGGDLSSLNVNPAGSVFFNNNFASFTANVNGVRNNATYFGKNTKSNMSNLSLNQIGGVLVFKDASESSNWKKISVGLNYENTNDFTNKMSYSGVNTNNSIGKYFLRFANGIGNEGTFPVANASSNFSNLPFIDQQAWLGYNSYLIEHDNVNNSYYTNVPDDNNYIQQKVISSDGYAGKLAFNFATSYKDIVNFGINLNLHFTDNITNFRLSESNDNVYPTGISIANVNFDNELHTYGSGFSLNLGTIVKATESIRIGVSYQSPTWFSLQDELRQKVTTLRTEAPDDNIFLSANANPDVTMINNPYKLKTPGKITGSFAYIFGKKGLISVDVAKKDYGTTLFKPKNDPYFIGINDDIKVKLADALEYRIGGEYKIERWSVRTGYRHEKSPYNNDVTLGDLTSYSGGLGYNFGVSRLDFAYSHAYRNGNDKFISSVQFDNARIQRKDNTFVLTYSVNF